MPGGSNKVKPKTGFCQDPRYRNSLWFSRSKAQQKRAKELCRMCPILEQCREYVLGPDFAHTPYETYVAAGMTGYKIWVLRKEARSQTGDGGA